MKSTPFLQGRSSTEQGFTLIELMVAMIMGLVVIGGVMGVLVSQLRHAEFNQETMDARETLRGAASLLSSELRHASASSGDLYAIAANSFTVRSVQGTGVVCAKAVGLPRYALWQESGTFQASLGDSAAVLSATHKTWSHLRVSSVWPSPGAVALGSCAWSGLSSTFALEVQPVVPADTLGVGPGSVITAFRQTQYGLFSQNGRWWLGRRVGAAASYELVTGPLLAPANGGLVLSYYDSTGAVTADPAQVHVVEVVLRSESFGKARSGSGAAERRDSVVVKALLRN
jgi:prepilin-type N-terminal cleavage/methylation domain-containing protein